MSDNRRGRADARERVREARRAAVAAGTAPAPILGPRRRPSIATLARASIASSKAAPATPETRARISQSKLGRKHTPEHVAARIASRLKTLAEQKTHSAAYVARRKWFRSNDQAGRAVVLRQKELDMQAAALHHRPDLYADIRFSGGWRRNRRVWDRTGTISDGAEITVSGKVRIVWGLVDVPNG